MINSSQSAIYLIDTSAVLSGKPFYHQSLLFATSPLIAKEFSPGGRDYEIFELIKQKGLRIQTPNNKAMETVRKCASDNGELSRLSDADCELLALALEFKENGSFRPILLTDDYGIQNMAELLGLCFQSLSQRGITKTFKWQSRCRGCGRLVESKHKDCPICGSPTVQVVQKKKSVKKKRDE